MRWNVACKHVIMVVFVYQQGWGSLFAVASCLGICGIQMARKVSPSDS